MKTLALMVNWPMPHLVVGYTLEKIGESTGVSAEAYYIATNNQNGMKSFLKVVGNPPW